MIDFLRTYALGCMLCVLTQGCGGGGLDDFSVQGRSARPAPFATHPPAVSLERVFRIEQIDGASEPSLGFIGAAALAPTGEIVVADVKMQRVVVLSPQGKYVRTIGGAGQGPGEFVAPFTLTFVKDTLAIYDERQGRVSLYDGHGKFARSFKPPTTFVHVMRGTSTGTILVSVGAHPSPLLEITTTGTVVRSFLSQPPIERLAGQQYLPEPGSFCTHESALVYLNPWFYELVYVSASTERTARARTFRSDLLRPLKSDGPSVGGYVRGGGTVGLACTGSYVIASYIDLRSGLSHVDFLTAAGEALGRVEYDRNADPDDYPGVLADANDSLIVSFRNRPTPRVMLWRITNPKH